jgi:hypothetical protein
VLALVEISKILPLAANGATILFGVGVGHVVGCCCWMCVVKGEVKRGRLRFGVICRQAPERAVIHCRLPYASIFLGRSCLLFALRLQQSLFSARAVLSPSWRATACQCEAGASR